MSVPVSPTPELRREPEFSDAQVMGAISAALREGDMPAVVSLLHVLALQNPREAGLLYDTVMLLAPKGATS